MAPHKASTLVDYCLMILVTIISLVIIGSISNTSGGGGMLLATAQMDGIGGLLGGGTQRAQQVMQCFTGCGQQIVGCGVTCTLGSSQSIEPCFTDCGLATFVCMNACFQPTVPPEDNTPSQIPSPSPCNPDPSEHPCDPSRPRCNSCLPPSISLGPGPDPTSIHN